MDPLSITVAALVVKALDSLASEGGRAAWAGLSRLVGAVRARFAGDDAAQAALTAAEAAPTDETRTRELAGEIDRVAAQDTAFRTTLAELVREAEGDKVVGGFVTKVSGNAQVDKIVNIGDVTGNVSF
jgi:hypothetical protein